MIESAEIISAAPRRKPRCDLYAVEGDGAETLCAVARGTVLSAAQPG